MSATKLSKILVTGAVFSMALVGYVSVLSGVALAEGEAVFASPERSQAAIGHYARARAMLVEALAEFEEARRVARPDMLLDPEEWRLSVISRTEELNRVLDPQPRVTRSGVKYKANKLLIRRERDRLPAVMEGAQDSNAYGPESNTTNGIAPAAELDKLPEPAGVRARMKDEAVKSEPVAAETPIIAPMNPTLDSAKTESLPKAAVAAEEAQPVETKSESSEGMQADEGDSALGKAAQSNTQEASTPEDMNRPENAKSAEELDESEESQAISQAIQERLKRLDQMKAATDN